MNKNVRRILWAVAILLGVIIIAAAVFIINFLQATKSMTPAETGAVNDSVWCIRDRFVNAYIFRGEKSYLLVDAGISSGKFHDEMLKAGIEPDQITTLLLTHTDGDHIGATGLFRNAAIYIHRDEEQMINGTTGKTKYSKTIWKYGPYKLVDDNDSMMIDGLSIRVIHTPGHTPGSVCYIIGNDYLVTGDNLNISGDRFVHFVEKFNMNTPEQEESLKKLPAPSNFKYILTAHGGIKKVFQ